VFLGKYRGETVAVKQLNVTQNDISAIQTGGVEQEIKLMTQLRSPLVVSFYGAMVCLFFIGFIYFFFSRDLQIAFTFFSSGANMDH